MNLQPLLIELGTEELPVKVLPGLAQAFFDGIVAGLEKRGIPFDRGEATPLYTPRRLAVLLPGVADEQPEQFSEVLGPYANVGLDAEGQATRALLGFAAKNGVEWTALARSRDAKGERFVHRAVTPGASTAALLPAILDEAIAAMPIPKPMRWGDHDFAFARPLHWLVLLLGADVVKAEVFGISSGRDSRGHRFHHPEAVSISQPLDYVATLANARVIVDPVQRRERVRSLVTATAESVGGTARISEDNLAQVTALVEYPAPVLCSFERRFLAVPQEALIETMEINQKFFPVLDAKSALTEHFIGIANIQSTDVSKVRAGYERVIRPRFADAKFFFDEDLKQGLVAMGAGLSQVTYQARLGSIADKVMRVAALAQAIAPALGVDPALAQRAAHVAKNDLQSRMVNEFPELQGIAGRHYAKAAGLPAELATAIDEAWQPRFSADAIAASPLGRVLAIAERIDTLAGGFSVNLKPTGNKDPFALRRAALGLARTLIEAKLDLDLPSLLDAAVEAVHQDVSRHGAGVLAMAPADSVAGTAIGLELYEFIVERLRSYYAEQGITTTQFNAVAAVKPQSLADLDRRIEAVRQFALRPEAEALAAANKRIGNILRKVEGAVPDTVDAAALVEPAERELAQALSAIEAGNASAWQQHDYIAVLQALAQLRAPVDAFFDQVMVMAEDPRLRANRLALLQRIASRFLSVAAIEHLSL